MKEKRLIPFIPLYLTFDATISFICLMAARVLSIVRKEVRWIKLAKGRYYHNGTEIRTEHH